MSLVQIVVIAIGAAAGAAIIALVTYVFTRARVMFGDVRQTRRAVVGQPGTKFHPEAIPGLASVVPEQGRDIVRQGALLLQQGELLKQHGLVLESLVSKANLVNDKADLLVKDTKSNDGTSSSDKLDRIEAAVSHIAAEDAPGD